MRSVDICSRGWVTRSVQSSIIMLRPSERRAYPSGTTCSPGPLRSALAFSEQWSPLSDNTLPDCGVSFPRMTSPPEVWLRGAVPGIQPLLQPAAHAIIQAGEDVLPIVQDLTPNQLWARPGGAASIGFH